MKLYIFSVLIFSFLFSPVTTKLTQLPLLSVKKNFKLELIDSAIGLGLYPTDVVMIRVKKQTPKKSVEDGNDQFEVRFAAIEPSTFAYFSFTEDRYFGYFVYEKHIVLVYGDSSPEYFFSKTKIKRGFTFLSYKPYDYTKHPPVAIEDPVLIYTFSKGQFNLSDAGRLGFYR